MTTDTSALAMDLATALGAFFAAELALAAALGFVLYAIAWLIGATLPAPQLPRLEASLNATTVIVPTSTRSATWAWMMKATAKIGVAGTPAQRASHATHVGWTARAITGSRCVWALAFFLPACILRWLVPFVSHDSILASRARKETISPAYLFLFLLLSSLPLSWMRICFKICFWETEIYASSRRQ